MTQSLHQPRVTLSEKCTVSCLEMSIQLYEIDQTADYNVHSVPQSSFFETPSTGHSLHQVRSSHKTARYHRTNIDRIPKSSFFKSPSIALFSTVPYGVDMLTDFSEFCIIFHFYNIVNVCIFMPRPRLLHRSPRRSPARLPPSWPYPRVRHASLAPGFRQADRPVGI